MGLLADEGRQARGGVDRVEQRLGAEVGVGRASMVSPNAVASSSTTWTATMVGPPLGGAAIGLFGPVTTVIVDAVSYLLSATGIWAARIREPHPVRTELGSPLARLRAGDLLDGWRYILAHRALRPLFFNTMAVNGLIMVALPLITVLMLGRLGFRPWQYGLAFAAPCVGGLIGFRLAGRLVARFGRHRVMLPAGALRACWPIGLAFIRPGVAGIVLVIAVQLGLVTCCGVFNPVLASPRIAIAIAGLLLLATPAAAAARPHAAA